MDSLILCPLLLIYGILFLGCCYYFRCDRFIAALDGPGMEITVGTGSRFPAVHTITPDTQPFFFSGDEQTRAKLINEQKSNDFNVISDRLQVKQKSMNRLKLGLNQSYTARRTSLNLATNESSMIYCNEGSVCISTHSQTTILNRGDSCLIESAGGSYNYKESSEINILMSAISNNDIIISKVQYL